MRPGLRERARSWGIRGAIAIALLAMFTGTAAAAGYLYAASADNPIAFRGCVVRFDKLSSSGKSVVPHIHANEGHYCVGFTRVEVDWESGNLVMIGSAGPVVVAFADEDETFSRRGIMCGPSGGLSRTDISCYRDGRKIPAYSTQLYGRFANLWIGAANWDAP